MGCGFNQRQAAAIRSFATAIVSHLAPALAIGRRFFPSTPHPLTEKLGAPRFPRIRKAMAMLDMAGEIVARGPVLDLRPAPLVYDPTDGDELAEQERRRRRKRLEQQDDDRDEPGGIGR